MMDDYGQIDLFEGLYDKPKLPKHVRLIEFFAGIGAQAKALEILGADFEHWRTVEWSWKSITAYNAIHMGGRIEDTSDLTYEEVLDRIRGVSNDYNEPMSDEQLRAKKERWARELLGRMLANHNYCPDVSKVHAKDLGIEDRENNLFCLTYSFPCQDLSLAGDLRGMERGSGTRSGLLWEVERILGECKESDSLPQVLIMENVPGVCGLSNVKPWNEWLDRLRELGYTSYYQILNAKDFGIPQNRRRCFMVSILGDYSYSFPRRRPLRYALKDFIKKKVDDSYYLSDRMVRYITAANGKWTGNDDGAIVNRKVACLINTAPTQRRCDASNYIVEDLPDDADLREFMEDNGKCIQIGSFETKGMNEMTSRIYSTEGISPAMRTFCGGNQETKLAVPNEGGLKVRKLTEGECYRLMGFEEKDTQACMDNGQSKTNIYHQAGDSIVTTVLVGIFGELLGYDYEKAIDDYADRLHAETEERQWKN